MKKLSEYLTQLNFDYAITYSGLRGEWARNINNRNALIIYRNGKMHPVKHTKS